MTESLVLLRQPETWPQVTWLDNVKSKTMEFEVTPAMAEFARINWLYNRQRPISKEKVAVIMRGMETIDQFGRHPEWEAQIQFCILPDGRMFLTNGNHTLEALRAANVRSYWVTVHYRFCRSMDEVHTVYIRTDAGKKRTSKDKILATEGSYSKIEAKQLSSVNYIARSIGTNFPKNMMPEEQEAHRKFYSEALSKAKVAIEGGSNYEMILEQAIFAIVLIIFKYEPVRAAEFCHALSFDDGLRAGHPAKALLNYYHKHGKRNVAGKRSKLLARAITQAWNAFHEGREINHLSPRTEHSITIIKGCVVPDWLQINL